MEVRYTVTLDDFVAFSVYTSRKVGSGCAYLVWWFWMPLLCAASAVWLLQRGHIELAFGPLTFGTCWLFGFPSRHRDAIARNVRTTMKKFGERGMFGERLLIFSEDSLIVVSEAYRIEARWENIASVDVAGDHTYIFVSGLLGLILPRHGFDNDAEYEVVRDFALRKFGARDE